MTSIQPRPSGSNSLVGTPAPTPSPSGFSFFPSQTDINTLIQQGGSGLTSLSQLQGTLLDETPQPAKPTPPVTAPPVTQAPPPAQSGAAFATTFNKNVEVNPLNAFYQPTYHFRLFVTTDDDLLTQVGGDLSNVSNIPQVVIAESGVTGYSITDVNIETVNAGTGITDYQSVTNMTMTVVDPVGVSFLDALYAAAGEMEMKNYTKGSYYLSVVFRGYDDSGNLVQAINVDGQTSWIWSLALTKIDTKITEGGGTFKLTFVNVESQPLIANKQTEGGKTLIVPEQGLTVSGKTVKAVFQDFVTKINAVWNKQYDSYKQNSPNNLTLVQFSTVGIQTNPIVLGPFAKQDPGDFTLVPQQPNQSSTLTWTTEDNTPTCHIPPNMSVNDFVISTINASEMGQKAIIGTNNQQTVDTTNAQSVRESTLFTIEPRIKVIKFDQKTNNYQKEITLNVIGHYNQNVILGPPQRDGALNAASQQNALQRLVENNLYRKQYEYIFTSQNTEVLELDISWNMMYQAMLAKLAGARATMDNCAFQGVTSSTSTAKDNIGPPVESQLRLNIQPLLTTIMNNKVGTESLPSASPSQLINAAIGSFVTKYQAPTLVNTVTPLSVAPITAPAATAKPTMPAAAEAPSSSGTTYIEDELNYVNQQQPVPVSFWHGNTDYEAGQGYLSQYHQGLSVVGTVFAQVDDAAITGAWQKIEMTIRGDPFWLGQTNLQRQQVADKKAATYDKNSKALPDYASAQMAIYVRFLYPLQIGDDFRPVLKSSEVFDGMYTVIKVVHSFAEGTFKQTVTAVRMPLIDVKTALGASSSASSAPPPSTGAASPAAPQAGSPTSTPTVTPTFISANARYRPMKRSKI